MAVPSNATQSIDDAETQPLTNKIESKASVVGADLECMIWVGVWMFFSSFVVIFNKWIFTSGGFPYPLALNALHMYCCFFVFGSIRRFAPAHLRAMMMPDADVVIPWPMYLKHMMLLAVLYSTTLGSGNLAYLFSSVAFIQMMKPMNAIYASLAGFAIGVEVPTVSHVIIVGVVVLGVLIATSSAADMSMAGVALQTFSSCAEGFRLALMQLVTSRGLKLDPVTTIYHLSLVSAVALTIATIAIEWPLKLGDLRSPWVLVINCFIATLLNVLVANVIKKTSAVIFALSGVVKDLGIIGGSCVIFGTPLTLHQCQGYIVSTLGLAMYKAYKDNLEYFKENGFVEGMRFVVSSFVSGNKDRLSKR
jgi:hypothetical protein